LKNKSFFKIIKKSFLYFENNYIKTCLFCTVNSIQETIILISYTRVLIDGATPPILVGLGPACKPIKQPLGKVSKLIIPKPPEHWRPMRKIALNFLPINQNRPWQPFPPTATYPNDVVAWLLLTPAVSTSPLPYLGSIFMRLPCKSRFFWNVR